MPGMEPLVPFFCANRTVNRTVAYGIYSMVL